MGGVSSIIVSPTSTKEPSASVGLVDVGLTIYHGDTLEVSAVASSQFELNTYTTSYLVSGNVAIQITAKQVLFDVIFRAVYNGEVIASTTQYNIPIGKTLYSSSVYSYSLKIGDSTYTNPDYETKTINASGMTLTTTYKSRVNPYTTAPILNYQYLDEDVSQEKYVFNIHIYDKGLVGGRVYMIADDNPTCTDYLMQASGRFIGNLSTSFDLDYQLELSYEKSSTYIHICIYRSGYYTEISTIRVSA